MLFTLLFSSAMAADVLLPEFTPGTFSDFALAETITAETLQALEREGLSIAGPQEILVEAEALALGCADNSDCPSILLEQFGAELIVVGSVTVLDAQVRTVVRLYVRGDAEPLSEISRLFDLELMSDFSAELAQEVLSFVSVEPSLPVLEVEAELIEDGETSSPYTDESQSSSEEADYWPKSIRSLPPSARAKWRASGMEVAPWLASQEVRTGSVLIEAWGGLALGEVDRQFDTRVGLSTNDDGEIEVTDTYEYESFVKGNGAVTGLSIAYMPMWWLDVGLYGGVLFAEKNLSAGWEQVEDEVFVDDWEETYAPSPAVLFVIEPRMRLYFVATGPIKPYALWAMHLRIYDGYVVPDLDDVDFPNRPDGRALGPTFGGGLAFDAPGSFIGFIEVPWTLLLSPDVWTSGGETLLSVPATPKYSGQTLAFRAGVGVRF